MTTTQIVVLIVVVLLVLALAAFFAARAKRAKARERLRSTFGPEYDRTVAGNDGRRREAERELAERAARRSSFDIRPLPEADRRAFADRWRSTQADFVDQPAGAVQQADRLVAEVMQRRGDPVGDFDQQARDVSVDHGEVVQEYRAAHDISLLNDRDQASTEQLRQAMVHYRALFQELLHDGQDDGRDERVPDHDRSQRTAVTDERLRTDVPAAGNGADEDRRGRDADSERERVDVVRVHRERLDADAGPATGEDDRRLRTDGPDDGRDEQRLDDDRRLEQDGTELGRSALDRSEDDRSELSRSRVEPGGLHRVQDGGDRAQTRDETRTEPEPRTEPGGLRGPGV